MKILTYCFPVLSLIAFLNGCSSYLPTDFYLIRVEPVPAPEAEPFPLRIDVGDIRAPVRYQNQVVFRRGPYQVGFYEHSRWAALPSEMVRRALIDALNASGLFPRVELIGQNPQADVSLLAEIESFDQVVDGEDLRADFSVIIEAARADTGSTIWSCRAAAEVPQPGPGELAAAMSEAVGRALAQAIGEMANSEELRGVSPKPLPE